MSQKKTLTAVDITQDELSLVLCALEDYVDEGIVVDDVVLYSDKEVGDLWLKLCGVEARAKTNAAPKVRQ